MNENTLDTPLASWSDSSVPPDWEIDTFGLTAVGSAVFYRYDCSRASDQPEGICLVRERENPPPTSMPTLSWKHMLKRRLMDDGVANPQTAV